MNKKKTTLHGLALLSPLFLCLYATGGVEKAELPSTDRKYVGTIRNDTVWKDTNGNEIWCNGGHMIREGNTFYWVGYETKPQMGFRNIKLYSSTNLVDCKFENNILRRESPLSILGWAGRLGLLHNRSTKKYVLIIEADSQHWERHKVGFAQSDTINGDYQFVQYVYTEGQPTAHDLSGQWSNLKMLPTESVSKDSFNTQHDFVIPEIDSAISRKE